MQKPLRHGPYEPPAEHRGRPAVILWFRAYAVLSLLVYGGFLLLWHWLMPPAQGGHLFRPHPIWLSPVVTTVALALASLFAVGALVPHKPWGWQVGLVAVALGLVSCTAVFAFPLLVFWLKPETKAAFGRL